MKKMFFSFWVESLGLSSRIDNIVMNVDDWDETEKRIVQTQNVIKDKLTSDYRKWDKGRVQEIRIINWRELKG